MYKTYTNHKKTRDILYRDIEYGDVMAKNHHMLGDIMNKGHSNTRTV
jgi:hypothetical protein